MRARLEALGWDTDLVVEAGGAPPEPAGDEVVVEVEACGVCGRDCIDRAGRFGFVQVPVTPGHEAVGRVVAVGPEVTDWSVGQRVATMHRDGCGACEACLAGEASLCGSGAAVLGLLHDGGYANWLAAPQGCFYAVPEGLDPALAAVLNCTLGTAWRGLTRAGTRAGSRVLVTGSNGGVGLAAVSIARSLGATTLAVVRSTEHVDAVQRVGADEVLVDDGSEFHKRLPGGPVDVAIDCVGAPTLNAALRSLVVGGRLVAVGNITGERIQLNIGYVITFGLQIIGSSGATRADMAALLAHHAENPVDVPIHDRMPLAEADRAQRLVAAGGLEGRIVLIP
ncbi:GroES-like protein [Aeromicrobium marinum DSM 15272]|uniref:alcohol dehydrogenase n=1 Tax=Aeromicrobium marinum DSM 15272 TaxID=585531 RepID=E2SEN3_9ACTN|nr:alcohol dehydrogenase catalytic domain-containing protein [Aeromicrobium marinum]EFQ82330.1 GroES-like protein [Aeromicrobium marinum DSM 15272]